MAKSRPAWTRDAALVLALAVSASASLVLASSRLMGNTPPCGPWVGCSMTIVSRAYRVAGMPLWAVPLATAPLALLLAVALGRRAATALLAVAAGTMLKGEWILYRFGWICPWCTLSTVGLGAAALLSWGIARARPPMFALGSALVVLGLPLALLRSPDAPRKAPSLFPLEVESIEAIDREKLTLSANGKEGVGVFVGDPRAPGARERVIPWARSRLARGWRLAYRPLAMERNAVARAGCDTLAVAWGRGLPGSEALFDPALDAAGVAALRQARGWPAPGRTRHPNRRARDRPEAYGIQAWRDDAPRLPSGGRLPPRLSLI